MLSPLVNEEINPIFYILILNTGGIDRATFNLDEFGHDEGAMICLSFLYLCYQEEARLKKEAEERAERERAELEEATQRRHRQEEWVGV